MRKHIDGPKVRTVIDVILERIRPIGRKLINTPETPLTAEDQRALADSILTMLSVLDTALSELPSDLRVPKNWPDERA